MEIKAAVLAAMEASAPYATSQPLTLETIDPVYDFGGKLTSETFTAHPKVDPKTGEMLAFGYAAKGLLTRDMVFYTISPDGEIQ